MVEQCEVKFCRDASGLLYYNREVCAKHFEMHCEGKMNLKTEFGIPEEKNETCEQIPERKTEVNETLQDR